MLLVMSNTTVYKDEDFRLSLEEDSGELFIHVKMEKASRSILERILWEFSKIKALAFYSGYDAIYTYSKDNRMFRIFGAEVIGSFEKDGEEYKVGKWDLKSFSV